MIVGRLIVVVLMMIVGGGFWLAGIATWLGVFRVGRIADGMSAW